MKRILPTSALALATIALIVGLMTLLPACTQYGCTDPNATNYDPDADEDDGSCSYTQEPQYAYLTIYRYGNCYEGDVDLYYAGSFWKTFTSYSGDGSPGCNTESSLATTFYLELGTYQFTAYADSNVTWNFYVNLVSPDECYTVALKCGGIVEGDGIGYLNGTGNLTVWSSFDFGADIRVKVDGVYRGRIRDYSTTCPPCGERGCVSVANLTPGIYHIDAYNGTYTWSNYTVLVREGWCNSFELE